MVGRRFTFEYKKNIAYTLGVFVFRFTAFLNKQELKILLM